MSGTETREEAAEKAAAQQTAAEKGIVCVIDLGEHSRRRVRRLRRGEGRLMEKVEDAVAALKEDNVLSAKAEIVVIVVRQEPSSLMGWRDDDDDDDDDD